MLFNIVPFMHSGCYSGFDNHPPNNEEEGAVGGFYQVYKEAFEQIVACERRQMDIDVDWPTDFGNGDSEWSELVQPFYQAWESFSSGLNFAWEDKYNVFEDAPNRRVRRLMEEENKKARRSAKKAYNQDIWTLIAFVKRRDPRYKAKQQQVEQQKLEQQLRQKEEVVARKAEQKLAKEVWREEAQQEMEEAEEADRLAGRVRLVDLQDDYDYGGGKKRGKGKKKKNKGWSQQETEEEQEQEEETPVDPEGSEEAKTEDPTGDAAEEAADLNGEGGAVVEGELDPEKEAISEEPDVFRCECCQEDFESEVQMQNHMKSKKHKAKAAEQKAEKKKAQEDGVGKMPGKGKKKNITWSQQEEEEEEEQEEIIETSTDPKGSEEAKTDDPTSDADESADLKGEGDSDSSEGENFPLGESYYSEYSASLSQSSSSSSSESESSSSSESESESSEELVLRCETCGKDFKSEGQLENHMKSKKHKESFKKKHLAKLKKQEDAAVLAQMMDNTEP